MNGLGFECESIMVGSPDVAAGTSETTTSVADMAGFDEIEYIVHFGDGTNGSVVTIVAKENTASSVSSPTPTAIDFTTITTSLASGVITSGDAVLTATATNMDDKIARFIIKKSAMSKRYQFLSITPATQNMAINSVIVIRRGARAIPVTDHADVIATAYAAA